MIKCHHCPLDKPPKSLKQLEILEDLGIKVVKNKNALRSGVARIIGPGLGGKVGGAAKIKT